MKRSIVKRQQRIRLLVVATPETEQLLDEIARGDLAGLRSSDSVYQPVTSGTVAA